MNPTLQMLGERLSMALALLETAAEDGWSDDLKATVELFLADTRHDMVAHQGSTPK